MRTFGFELNRSRAVTALLSLFSAALAIGHLFTGKPIVYDATLAVLTLTLVAVLWYMCFTYEAVELSREARRRRDSVMRRNLVAVAKDLLDLVNRLPVHAESTPFARDVLQATRWNDDRVDDLLAFGVEMGLDETAAKVASALRWLEKWVLLTQKAGPTYGFADFPIQEWNPRLSSARSTLERLASLDV